MAPTEVLAEQHAAGVAALLDGFVVPDDADDTLFGSQPEAERSLRVELLTSRTTAARRRSILGGLAAARSIFHASAPPEPEPVRRVLEAVLAEPERDWQAAEVASLAGVSYSRLRELFKTSRSETLHDFLQRSRLAEARRLLGDTRLTIKEVAARLHFSSEFYFSHFFRRVSGMSPTEYRRELSD
jgi:AraC-like DNA-binding protein